MVVYDMVTGKTFVLIIVAMLAMFVVHKNIVHSPLLKGLDTTNHLCYEFA